MRRSAKLAVAREVPGEEALDELSTALDDAGRQAREAARREARNQGAGDVTCRMGCAWCCHQKILATATEGAAIYVSLKSGGRWSDDLVAALRHADQRLTATTHRETLQRAIPCVFLNREGLEPGRGTCSVYSARPLGCRSWFSLEPYIRCADPDGPGFLAVPQEEVGMRLVSLIRDFETAFGSDVASFTLPGAVLYAAAKLEGEPDPGVHRCLASERETREAADVFDDEARRRRLGSEPTTATRGGTP